MINKINGTVKLHQVNLSAILGNPKINRPMPTDVIVCLIMATHKNTSTTFPTNNVNEFLLRNNK